MARGRVLTEEIKKRIRELAAKDLNVKEIAGALKINVDTVRKYMEAKKDVREPENVPGPEKKAGKRRPRIPRSDQAAESGEQPCPNSQYSSSERINFTGGKKHLNNGGSETMTKDEKDFDFECPKCHHKWNGSPEKCPKCGAELQE